jgi:cellulase/cellobiase CelA1
VVPRRRALRDHQAQRLLQRLQVPRSGRPRPRQQRRLHRQHRQLHADHRAVHPDNNATVGGQQIKSATFHEFNPYNSELAYAQALRNAFVASGMPQGTGVLIDPNKKFDAMCDPNARNRCNNAFPTNALPNAPHAGRWFPAA